MADPAGCGDQQLKNIQARTGKTIAELRRRYVVANGAAKHGSARLIRHFKLGYGDANTVALFISKAPDLSSAAASATAPLRLATRWTPSIYRRRGAAAPHEAVMFTGRQGRWVH